MSSRLRGHRRGTVLTLLIALVATLAGPAAGRSLLDVDLDLPLDACVTGLVDDAAAALLGPAAELVSVEVDSAMALTPGVYPGVRNRLLAVGDGWCDASAVNAVAAARGLTAPTAVAELAATVLAAPFFDQVTILESREVADGRVELVTHAVTNGVVAEWVVDVDALGVRRAEWTAVEFAAAPFEPQIEGLTALPTASWAYERTTTSGLVQPTTTIAQLAADDQAPSPFMSTTGPDDFTVHISVGDALFYPQVIGGPGIYGGVAPDPDLDTGEVQVDYLRIMREAAEVNMADFYDFGWRKGWVDDEGTIYVDGALSAYCLACVLVSEYFNVHMSRAAHEALGALGYSYPDARTALIDIVGHEIVHNFQNAYGKPSSVGGGRDNSYSEGMARFSETIHSYSAVSHQTGSLVYANDTNGCNGWQGNNADAAFAAGPLTGQSYDACYFWLTVHGTYGIDAFLGMLEHSSGLPGGRPWEIYSAAIEEATGDDITEVLANFARMSLTGRDYAWNATNNPDSPVLDWAEYLDRWTPGGVLGAGDDAEAGLQDGGMTAYELDGDVLVTGLSTEDGHAVALVVDDGEASTATILSDGDVVELAEGEDAWLVLLNGSTTGGLVTVELQEVPEDGEL